MDRQTTDSGNSPGTPTETSDIDKVIQSAQSGDRAAFARLVGEHYDMILRVASRYAPVPADAEDIAQVSCIKLARSIGQYRREAAFTTWLYRLVVNCAHDFRRQGDTPVQELADIDAAVDNGNPAEQRILLEQVLAAAGSLGDGYLDALVLVVAEGLTHAEAAAILEVKESTVSWRVHEVRKHLRTAMAGQS